MFGLFYLILGLKNLVSLTHTPPGVGGCLQKVASERLFGRTWASEGKKVPPQAGLFLDFLASEAFETHEKTCFRRPEYVRNRAVAVRHRQKKIRLRRALANCLYQLTVEYCYHLITVL